MKKNFGKVVAILLLLVMACVPITLFAEDVNVASVDGTPYTSVQEAIDNANGKTVVLLSNVTESVTIPAETTVTLDLGEFTLTNVAGQHTIVNKGTLTITGNGVVDNVSHGKGALVNNGTATLAGGTLTRSQEKGVSGSNGGNSWHVVDNNGGTMTVTGGKVINTSGYSSLIRNLNAAFYMQGGELQNTFIALKNDDNGKIEMTDGTITTTGTGGSAIQNWGDLTMTSGELNAPEDAAAIYALTWKDEYISTASVSGDAKINGNILMTIDTNYADSVTIVPEMEIDGAEVSGNIIVDTDSELTIDSGVFAGTIVSRDDTGVIVVNGGNYTEKPADEYINVDSTVVKYTTNNTNTFIIGTADEVENQLTNVVAGDQIEVMQGDMTITVPTGVVVTNNGDGIVIVNGDTVEEGSSVGQLPSADDDGDFDYGTNNEENDTDKDSDKDSNPDNPNTGDAGDVAVYFALAVVAAGVLGVAAKRMKK